jgi:hypothetical protein
LKAALIAGVVNEGGIAFAYSGDIANIDSTALPVVDGTVPIAPVINTVSADISNSLAALQHIGAPKQL